MTRFKGSLIVRLFLLLFALSIVPLGILAWLTSETSRRIEEISINEGSLALVEETRVYLGDRTVDYARQIDLQLEKIESDARVIATQVREILADPDTHRVPWKEGRYTRADNGIFWTHRDYGGSNLFVSRRTVVTAEMKREISSTELLDPIMKEVYQSDPNTTYLFFASVDNLIRGYPWFDAMAAVEGGTLDPDLNLKDEPLFYVAAPGQLENREEVWSEVYLDAAGRGWMVTCVTPVFTGDDFLGVIGIDVGLELIRENILDLELSGDGYAFMLTHSGNVLAYPPEAGESLGWEAGMTPNRFNLLASTNAPLAGIAREMVGGNRGISDVIIAGREMLVSYAPVEAARWSLGLVVPVESVTQRAALTSAQIEEQTGGLIRNVVLMSIVLFLLVVVATYLAYRKTADPLNKLVTGAARIGEGELQSRVEVYGDGEIGKLASTFNDMADSLQRRDVELARVQGQLLDAERLSSMGKVAAAVAHEIRNTLGIIRNSAYYLRQKLGGTDSQVDRHLVLIEEEISAANHIVSELLDFTARPALQPAVVSVNELIMEVLGVFGEKDDGIIRVENDLCENLRPIIADPAGTRHVLYNVIQNACQAMNGDGVLHVKTESMRGGVRITVKDSGRGMEKETMERLFEPFYTTRAKGIGLGLSISKKIVESHGGDIRVGQSTSDGTTVIIELPLNQAVNGADPNERHE